MSKVFISCAVTGSGDTAGKHPDLPKTPEQIATAAIEAANAWLAGAPPAGAPLGGALGGGVLGGSGSAEVGGGPPGDSSGGE